MTSRITRYDDLTGLQLTTEADPVKVTIDGVQVVLDRDLSPASAAVLAAFFSDRDDERERVPAMLRRMFPADTNVKTRTTKPSTGGNGANSEVQAVREWGRANGFEVNDRGNLKKDLKDAYAAAHPTTPATDTQTDAPSVPKQAKPKAAAKVA